MRGAVANPVCAQRHKKRTEWDNLLSVTIFFIGACGSSISFSLSDGREMMSAYNKQFHRIDVLSEASARPARLAVRASEPVLRNTAGNSQLRSRNSRSRTLRSSRPRFAGSTTGTFQQKTPTPRKQIEVRFLSHACRPTRVSIYHMSRQFFGQSSREL